MGVHDLKIWPPFFEKVQNGTKRFEIRKRDRSFNVGDTLHLQEYDPVVRMYTGRAVDVTVTYIFDGEVSPSFGLLPGFVCMSIMGSL